MATVAQFDAAACDCTVVDVDTKVLLLEAASDMVALITGGVVAGRAYTTYRPVRDGGCDCGADYGYPTYDGSTVRVSHRCYGCELNALPLPGTNPEVTKVMINGAALAAGTFTVLDGKYLIRVGTGAAPPCWPESQSLWRPDSEPDTFSVTVNSGVGDESNTVVANAVVELACEYAKAFSNQATKLPRGAQAASYQGVTVQMRDAATAIAEGHENLPNVTRLLSAYAPIGRSGGVYSPDSALGWTMHILR